MEFYVFHKYAVLVEHVVCHGSSLGRCWRLVTLDAKNRPFLATGCAICGKEENLTQRRQDAKVKTRNSVGRGSGMA